MTTSARTALRDAYLAMDEALALLPTRVIHRVINISHDLLDDEVEADDIEAWSREAADRILNAGLSRAVLFQPEVLRPPRAALLFMAAEEVLAELGEGVDAPNLLEVWLGTGHIDWKVQPDRHWKRLEKVSIHTGPDLGRGLYPWLSRQTWPGLRELWAASCNLRREDFHALLKAPFWPSLEAFDLSSNAVCAGDAPWPSSLAVRDLRLDCTRMDDSGLAALLRSTPRAIEHLDVSSNDISVDGLAALVAAPMPVLRHLGARGNRFLHTPIWDVLARSFWPDLRHLDIGADGSDPDGLLSAAAIFASVSSLNVGGCALGDAGTAALASLPFSRLGTLSLTFNTIGLVGIRALAAAALPDLEEIDLSSNAFGDDGVRALTAARWWPRVRRVSLHRDGLTDAALEVLARQLPPAIEKLEIGTRYFGDESVARLRAALPAGARLR
jgi:hypothetical protein